MNERLNELKLWWLERNERERLIMVLGLVVLCGMVLVNAMILPVVRGHQKSDEAIERRSARLLEIVQLERSLRSKGKTSTATKGRRLGSTSPISFIESVAAKAKVKDKLRNIRPGNTERVNNERFTTISFQVDELTMHEMVAMLYQLEVGSGYAVEVQRFKVDRKERKEVRRVNISAQIRVPM